jgi:N-glycosylase/DNA lyase
MAACTSWRSIPCKISQIRLDIILTSGQSFRWRQTGDKEWTSVLKGKVWTVSQDEQNILYRVYEPQKDVEITSTAKNKSDKKAKKKYDNSSDVRIGTLVSTEDNDSILRDYFQLDVDLLKLYSRWSELDPYFSRISKLFPGVRALRQDPIENLFSFICSSNNNISRITGMIEKLCVLYGEKLTEVDGVEYFSFPNVNALSDSKVEGQLRAHGFGYRAKFIQQSAKAIQEKGTDWLGGLRHVDYEIAHKGDCIRAAILIGRKTIVHCYSRIPTHPLGSGYYSGGGGDGYTNSYWGM